MNRDVLFATGRDEHETPRALFDALDAEFDFDIDLAATAQNALCSNFYSKEDDALTRDWYINWFRTGFCNPPYSRGLQAKFIRKAAAERLRGFTTVMLLPARTDTKVFHECLYDASTWQWRTGIQVRLLPGRLKFSGVKAGAPFPSMVVIFRGAKIPSV